MNDNYRIEIADTKEKYEGLRTLWCEVFNDETSFIDGMYGFFGANPNAGIYTSEEIKGYVCLDNEHRVASALTCFRSGDFEGLPAYTSYAICTDPGRRSLGLAGSLVEHVRDIVLESGGVSIISPAEPSLENFYGAHGYEVFFSADVCGLSSDEDEEFIFSEEDSEYKKYDPGLSMKELSSSEYNERREDFLENRPHVIISESMMKLIHDESRREDGRGGLVLINKGDAICVLGEEGEGELEITELLINPKLAELSPEIAPEIAVNLAEHFGKKKVKYTAPGSGKCQSMIAARDAIKIDSFSEAYYGFPID